MLNMTFSSFWDIFAIPFGYVMHFFNFISGGHYLLSLFLFSLVVKLVMLPMSIKQQKTQIKGAMLRPRLSLIEKKYAGRTDRVSMQKKQQEMMELQQQEGYSPLSGCLPLLIQFPIIIALYRIIRMPLKYIAFASDALCVEAYNALFTPENPISAFKEIPPQAHIDFVNKIADAGGFTSAGQNGSIAVSDLPSFKIFGKLDLSFSPSFKVENLGGVKANLWLLLIPFLCAGLAYLTTVITKKMNSSGIEEMTQGDQRSSQFIMNLMMPLMNLWIAFTVSAAVGVYWVYTSVLGILQIVILAKVMPLPKYTDEEIKQMQKEIKSAKSNGTRSITSSSVDADGKPKSLHYEDDEDEY